MDGSKFEYAELQARLHTLNYRKEEVNQEISQSLKMLNDALSSLMATRRRLRGSLEEARAMEQVLLKSAKEEAMVSESAGDGEKDTERVESSNKEDDETENTEQIASLS